MTYTHVHPEQQQLLAAALAATASAFLRLSHHPMSFAVPVPPLAFAVFVLSPVFRATPSLRLFYPHKVCVYIHSNRDEEKIETGVGIEVDVEIEREIETEIQTATKRETERQRQRQR